MEHQDFKVVTFNSKIDKIKLDNIKEVEKKISQMHINNDEIKMEAPKKLGLLISQGRTSKGFKSQKDLATKLGVSAAVVQKWENNSIIPTNLEIANIEKAIGVKLPRSKKIKDSSI